MICFESNLVNSHLQLLRNYTMNLLPRLALLVLAGISVFQSAAQADYIRPGDAGLNEANHLEGGTRAAACPPSTAIRNLEWNNVRALLETGGNMWEDRANYLAAYEVPKDVGVSVVFAAALWMGGLSPDQQLKLAAVRFRQQGNDYWPGPLTTDGTAETDELQCLTWDKFFVSEKADSQRHRQYYDCLNDPGCDLSLEFPEGYVMPTYFTDYPAHGNTALNQDYYLAPFLDYDGDGNYNPTSGDYPWYDFLQEINCFERRRTDPVPLFGDQTYFWIFNDKGNVHSESQGEPIGMEIRAQAFAFATNDEVNNMTYYNYVLINQGTQTLTNTYFGSWVESDVGGHTDDYVGCDVQRGLGYAYNGDAFDDATNLSSGYGEHPPAFGVDFFEGPFQDEDGIDNPLTDDFQEAFNENGIPYKGIGIGYGDGVIDNERFGMRKFVFFNYVNGINGPPTIATDYYNYLRGFWKNGQRMAYGGNGLNPLTGTDLSIPADYMFPGDTDPYNWGTLGVNVEPWDEVETGNPPGDRSFIQSAGPFVLEPGDYNNITLGVVYARAFAGEPFESVELVRLADDKAQALFDNCFELISGPDAPDVEVQELDRELVLYWTNENILSNNFNEEYTAFDPGIPAVLEDGTVLDSLARTYTFEGYQVYQLADATVSVSDLDNIEKARLIYQCDIQNDITQLVNYTRDPEMDLSVPHLMANGANEGLSHSLQITSDAFASGDTRLINHKTYYFMVQAYGYNNYRDFNSSDGTGQDEQYKASRKGAVGALKVYTGIPHSVNPEAGGTTINAAYGDGIAMTRLEGRGCGKNILEIDPASEAEILANVYTDQLTYLPGGSPVNVKVIDPTRLPAADFSLQLAPDNAALNSDSVRWVLTNMTTGEVYESRKTFTVLNEDLLLDWGISITWNQYEYLNSEGENLPWFTDLLSGEIVYDDPTRPWMIGVEDEEGFTELNWIRAGNQVSEDLQEEIIFDDSEPGTFWDEEEEYEGVLNGTWSPYCLVSFTDEVTLQSGDEITMVNVAPTIRDIKGDNSAPPNQYRSNIKGLNNVDIVLTSDKSKWTRCGVFEAQGIPTFLQTQEVVRRCI